jgi:hypothetical protein
LRESGSARVQLRDIDGSPVDKDARAIIADRYTIPAQLRDARTTTGTGRPNKESPRAPSTGPSTTHAKRHSAA